MKEKLNKYGIYIAVVVVVVLFIVGISKDTESEVLQIYSENTEYEHIVEKTYIYVDLKGAVLSPGVYKVEHSSRLFQVVQMAGGLSPTADENAINLSMILSDQSVIYVPRIDEEYPNYSSSTQEENISIININSATLEQLQTLPGVGEVTAQSIIDYRTNNGNFNTIDEIMNVSGIGTSTFENIKEFITC